MELNVISKICKVTPAIAIIDGEVWINKMDIVFTKTNNIINLRN
ncbi:hypothetical protein [Clostridium tagluense]|nr:hypothetical protein [Clostridium tagluense]